MTKLEEIIAEVELNGNAFASLTPEESEYLIKLGYRVTHREGYLTLIRK